MKFRPQTFYSGQSAFTMVEIAISLAIIGIALVAIIGVLPLGMNVQKDNREETIINQDATMLIEAIRNGSRGADDLTNYVFLITNINSVAISNFTGGAQIIGMLSTPKYIAGSGSTVTNHIAAFVRSISGPAVEKPPQNNSLVTADSFSYKIICDNLPVETPNLNFDSSSIETNYAMNLSANLHELRLTFLWPLLPNGNVGYGHQTFRTLIAGRLTRDFNNTNLYFFQPQSFTNANAQ